MIVKIKCSFCEKVFDFDPKTYDLLGLREIPKHCPSCLDRRQERPVEIIERKCLKNFRGVMIEEIPGEFDTFRAQEGDIPCYRLTIKGKIGDGVSWHGRLDIYSYDPHPAGKFCDLRLMEVTRNRKNGEKTIKGEIQEYLVLEPSEAESDMKLVWLRADYKTTLKGLGRQYYASIDTDMSLWSFSFSSCCRSGRFGSKMALAIVDSKNYATEKVWGDIEREKTYL